MIIAHTPDADDAFLFYGMLKGKIATRVRVKHVVDDIEALNRRAFGGEIDVTALSVHAYAFLYSQYRILSAGASVGDGYGPVVVGRRDMELEGKKVAVPGKYTTANLILKLAIADINTVEMIRSTFFGIFGFSVTFIASTFTLAPIGRRTSENVSLNDGLFLNLSSTSTGC